MEICKGFRDLNLVLVYNCFYYILQVEVSYKISIDLKGGKIDYTFLVRKIVKFYGKGREYKGGRKI